MHRTFDIDGLACPRCGGRLCLIATGEHPRLPPQTLRGSRRPDRLVVAEQDEVVKAAGRHQIAGQISIADTGPRRGQRARYPARTALARVRVEREVGRGPVSCNRPATYLCKTLAINV